MALRFALLTGICLCLVSVSAFAEFYRYKDKNGVTRFTDNLAEVPEDQRPKIYKEEDDLLTPEQREKKAKQEAANRQQTEAVSDEKAEKTEEEVGLDATLMGERDALGDEFHKLEKINRALVKERKTVKTPEAIKAYNVKLEQHKKQMANLVKKRKAFNEKVEAYNAEIKKKLSPEEKSE